ncbi:glycosyltransferase family 2 protein [Apiospora marii]|uniref:glycosyltransferase family 2 protein n=1 Tax=Apiospora marii TaxID=335849 RepID=UPI00312F8AA8
MQKYLPRPTSVWPDHPKVSLLRQVANVIGCLCIFPLYRAAGVHTRYPATVDLLISIFFAEYCRFTNEGRRMALSRERQVKAASSPRKEDQDLLLDEKQQHLDDEEATMGLAPPEPAGPGSDDAVAMIVGWREDPELWRRCLESYKTASGWAFLIVGIDGDEPDDQEMINVFQETYPDQSCVLHIDEPLGEVATAVREREYAERKKSSKATTPLDEDAINEIAMGRCMDIARQHLEKHLLQQQGQGQGPIKHLLVSQRHLHKKGIMFTSLVFALVVAEQLGVRFVWTSDSDSLVRPDSVEGTIATMAADAGAGGASSGMVIHNADESLVARLSASVYWCDQYLTHALPASVGVSDCQSGPSAAFRLAAVRPILVPWYNQKVLGKRMVRASSSVKKES